MDYISDTFWSDDGDRLCAVGITHREEQAGKTGDMIRVKVRDQYGVDRLAGPAQFPEGYLCTLTAVDQNSIAVIAQHA